MLSNAKKMLNDAKNGKYAIGQFNINNLEWTKAILEVAEEKKSPVILGVSEGAARYMGGFEAVVGMVSGLDKAMKISVPVAIHLDHGVSFESAKAAIDAGFTSVMYDGSEHDIDTNILKAYLFSDSKLHPKFKHSKNTDKIINIGISSSKFSIILNGSRINSYYRIKNLNISLIRIIP